MRKIVRLMKNWQFIGPEGNTTTVDLPHTWNAIDGQDGGNDYWRGTTAPVLRLRPLRRSASRSGSSLRA